MIHVAVLYATREGQTKKVADRIASDLERRGVKVDLQDVAGATAFNLQKYNAAILAASVHAGHHESEMTRFVKTHLSELEKMPTAFLSVTVSEAGAERASATAEQHQQFVKDVQQVMDKFFHETGWHPDRVKPVAGALLYQAYNPLIRLIMRRIARKAGADTDTSRNYEYTDWVDLDRYVDELADEFAREAPDTAQEGAILLER